MTAYRQTIALATVAAGIAILLAFLMREGTGVGDLVLIAGISGGAAGTVWRGRQGLVIGVVLGAAVGSIAPYLYAPFWFALTLPPHPDIDL